ncbi:MAG TPA: pyruvate dehydrogenase (acetyl-transferring), homodimeric type [Baekduia sp.]|jgi:pyruvate dehydrogenase E1 component|nr:pyruvate dehydrogenase (acetyl-transferring), homodimeric type [Baekduia sp.]
MTTTYDDIDPEETAEWLEALDAVVSTDGPARAQELLQRMIHRAARLGAPLTAGLSTPYLNTLSKDADAEVDADVELERRIRAYIRWNAMAMVLHANAEASELGGHIASYQSAACLYEVGFNHFWHARSAEHRGDLLFFQGHSSPGIYARAFLEGRLTEDQLKGFRQEVSRGGLPSYPHPWLMPDFWQFPTVSMGLGPMMAVHQAYFMKYLSGRGIAETDGRKVWAFAGDGEMDEPESIGAIGLAGREHLDNLILVINCNLQRLDGPVRGNGKIIQELESAFRGSGWNVIKLVWGSGWDPLLEADEQGLLVRRMEEALDGDYQTYKSRDGAYVREHFFGASPELAAMVADWTDDEIWSLQRGGHDPVKVHAAYAEAVAHKGQPTVILAKTVKGYGMGEDGEGQNTTHQQKKMGVEALRSFRDRFRVPLTDEQIAAKAFVKLPPGSPEERHLHAARERLGGGLPAGRGTAPSLPVPDLAAFQSVLDGTGDREVSTTMAFVRVLSTLLRDKEIGHRVVPIVADESRTFGMEGMFRQLGIFSQVGQLYLPEDAGRLMFYKEDRQGQILQEGINEAGAIASWTAAATSYANHGEPMIPFYIFYSMFGFQRIGDFAWAAGDSRARGFLIGGTAGRTTLNGEGLQHEDGHSPLIAATIPNCVTYDPAYGYEVATIVQDGLRRMLAEQEDVFYYITTMNENYPQPAMPEGSREAILRGMHRIRAADGVAQVRLLGSGTILREVLAGADLLASDWGIAADVWSVTSFPELHRDGNVVDRWNRLHPGAAPRRSHVQESLGVTGTPVVVATDYVRALPELVRQWVDGRYTVLGTDGFGRSDLRRALRSFFEVDRHHVAVAALHSLAQDGVIAPSVVRDAIDRYDIDADVEPPWRR